MNQKIKIFNCGNIFFLVAAIAILTSASPDIRATDHAKKRALERGIDFEKALNAFRARTVSVAVENICDGERRITYEGYYLDVNHERTYFRMVTSSDGMMITVMKLNYVPTPPPLTQEEIERRNRNNENRKNRGNKAKECFGDL